MPSTANRSGPVSKAPRGLVSLTVSAAGIVFGDIGTSPLYALDQLFLGRASIPLSADNILGGISLVIWTLTVIVAVKYAIFVLRAQNDGEGGLFALYGLLHTHKRRGIVIFLWLLMLGAGLLFGDGMITPAISVLAAVEGLGVAAPAGGSIISVELSFGFMEEPNVERALEGLARHKEIDLPTDRRQWIVHVSHENLLPSQSMAAWQRGRLRLFVFLRRVSRPAYTYYGLGDEVQLSAETLPVRVR